MTILFIDQLTKINKQRSLGQAIARAYATFAQQYPEWTAIYFDDHFLRQQFDNVDPAVALPIPVVLAQAWANQLPGLDETTKQQLIAKATPVALAFMRLLDAELYPQSQGVGRLKFQVA